MQNLKTLLTIATLLSSLTLPGQELIKRKKSKGGMTEEFYVLKDNKDTRQGPILITYADVLDQKYVADFGQYDNNNKTGNWLSFYFNDPSNYLKSIGRYENNQKAGSWRYYYPTTNSGKSIHTLFGSEKRTNIIYDKKSNPQFKLEFDSAGQQIASTGKYLDDKKIGTWNYFSRSGYLLHSYDHDANRLVQNNFRQANNDFLVFLGGPENFSNYYYTSKQDIMPASPFTKTSEVIFEVDKNGGYNLVTFSGDENYKKYVEHLLTTIPNEWVYLDRLSTKRLQIISKVVVAENGFTRFNFSLDLKVVDSKETL